MNLIIKKILLFLGIIIYASFSFANDLDEIWKPSDEGWYDLTFKILDVQEKKDGEITVRAYGLYMNQKVGLAVNFIGGMKPGIVNNDIDRDAFARNGITYLSIGAESDALIEAISHLYRVKMERTKFVSKVSVTAFALGGDPKNIMNEKVKFKVFFNDRGTEEEYAELYTNIDIKNRVLELFEKDEEYRTNVLKALSAP